MSSKLEQAELLELFSGGSGFELERYAVDWNGRFAIIDLIENKTTGESRNLRLTFDGIHRVKLSGIPTHVGPSVPARCELSQNSTLLSDYEPRCGIYCTSPLPDPLRFYTEACLVLRNEILLPQPIEAYLNAGAEPEFRFERWLDLSYSRAYLLITGPEVLIHRCAELVEIQAVEYQIMPSRPEDEPSERPTLAWTIGRGFLPDCFVLAEAVQGVVVEE